MLTFVWLVESQLWAFMGRPPLITSDLCPVFEILIF
jgi:hypothetical protein